MSGKVSMMSQIQYKFNKNDEYYTPAYAIEPIMKRIPVGSKIWCPFDTKDSEYVKEFSKNYDVVYGHILTGQDFFDVDVPECDYIISNPPYSLKGEVFERLYSIGKPFAMLINLQGLFDNKKRFELFKNKDVQILYLSPRVNYIKSENESPSGVPFQSVYVCDRILDKQIEFDYVIKR